jgi:hypothetical protein
MTWWNNLSAPTSGVANCHVPGLYSLVFDEDTRVFILEDWTSLAANLFGEAVGLHNHHRSISIKVIQGELLNISAKPNRGIPHPSALKLWRWDSRLRGGKGKFTGPDSEQFLSSEWTIQALSQATPPLFIPSKELHTVQQVSKRAVWVVRELGKSSGKPTANWSMRDLSKWSQKDLYVPMSKTAIKKLWDSTQSEMK